MKLPIIACILLFMSRVAHALREERTSYVFAGSNNYYLHALTPQEQTAYIHELQKMARRLYDSGVSHLESHNSHFSRFLNAICLWRTWLITASIAIAGIASSCTKSSNTTILPNYEVAIGKYEISTLDAIDSVLFQLHAAGIKAIISPHDANLLPPNGSTTGYNGIDIYGRTYGTSYNFYTNATAQNQYGAHLASILNYISPRFHKRWAELHETILAFDLQNEPMIASEDLLNADDPSNWLCERVYKLKDLIRGSRVRIATGGIGRSQYSGHEYNLLDKALNCPAIDIMSVHGYMDQASQWAYFFPALSNQAAASGKHCMVEEWGVNTTPTNDDFAAQAAVFNSAGVPWLYWMTILGKLVDETCATTDGPCCHVGLSTDELYNFEISLTSSRASWSSLFHTAGTKVWYQD